MRGLYDVNLLIALCDPNHVFHEVAHAWYEKNAHLGWASCPITENGLLRILTNTTYPSQKKLTFQQVANVLRGFVKSSDHVFWNDDLSLLDKAVFQENHILSSKQLTDIYLLAIAVRNGGRLVTFDEGISIHSVNDAEPASFCLIT